MPQENHVAEGARLACLVLSAAAPVLRELIKLVHALRDAEDASVRRIARERLPPPQALTLPDPPPKPRKRTWREKLNRVRTSRRGNARER